MAAASLFETDPYLDERHRVLEEKVRAFGDRHLRAGADDEARPEQRTRELARALGEAGLLAPAVAAPHGAMDLRSLVAIREGLAYFSGLADSAFAMQGLGSHALSLAGTDVQKNRWLPEVVRGAILCAFAVTEPDAGSDLAAVRTRAQPEGALWRLNGVKTFISNAGIAGLYTVLARSGGSGAESQSDGSPRGPSAGIDSRREPPYAGDGHRGLSVFLVDADAPGIAVRRLEPMAAHPLGEVRFDGTPAVLLGEPGQGYGTVLATLDTFRPSVGAAACGLARRALDESLRQAQSRRQFGHALADFQSVQMTLADMYTELTAARLVVRHAAWLKDNGAPRIAREGAAAKLLATETAQRVVDRAVQLHGGQGVMRGATVERLYREVRALRIYEGTSEVQKLVIARQLLKERR